MLDSPQPLRDWLIHAEARRLLPALEAVQDDTLVFDAGCGNGFHACILARAGANVVGVDLDLDRLEVARHLAQLLVPDRPPRLVAGSVHRAVTSERWHVIWVNEAISHIDPIPPFLSDAAVALHPCGRMVISDHNGANPLVRLAHRRARGREIYTTKPDPATGEAVAYARERTFTPRALRRALVEAGFKDVRFHAHGFVPMGLRKGAAGTYLRPIEDGLRTLPGAHVVAGSYTAVATVAG